MSTKFFDTKKSGIVKKKKTMKTGLIAMAIVAVTTAAGIGGYKLMNRADERPVVAQTTTPSAANSYQSAPDGRSTANFSSFGFGAPNKSTAATKATKAKHGKHVAKHSKRHGKHYAKHHKKKHGKHYAKHHKKKHGKHYAKHHNKKHGKNYAKHKKKHHSGETTAAR